MSTTGEEYCLRQGPITVVVVDSNRFDAGLSVVFLRIATSVECMRRCEGGCIVKGRFNKRLGHFAMMAHLRRIDTGDNI